MKDIAVVALLICASLLCLRLFAWLMCPTLYIYHETEVIHDQPQDDGR